MKKYFFLILILIAGIFLFFTSKNSSQSNFSNYKIISYQLQNKNRRLLVADMPQKWERGLMNVKKLDAGIDGMIFIFPKKEMQTFWNKNTLMNLDIYWVDDKQIIGQDFLPAINNKNNEIKFITSPQAVDKAIEIPR